MSDEIDKRIVEMEFRNKKFQENAEQTIKTLDKLDESLDFNSGVGKSLDVIASKFTNLGVIGQGVLQNLSTDAYNLGKNLVKSLTVDQLGSGFGEYELKMGSIQTIMAGTGESLDVVNKKLSELNDYADRTIYSFSDMTANIGKFTNAGVKLDTAVSSIQGVANLAAVSGASAEQASHAMYNFAQALSAGYVKLVDWKSIEIANMATVEFKDELIKTALELGTIRKEGNKYITTTTDMNGSISDAFDATTAFNDSLSYQWLTTDVLTKTLGRYTDETTELGKKAFKSATELKTFSMMMGALKESAGSGWAQTMEIIFGDYDEAIELWTGLFNRIDGWMSNSAKRRNDILTAWKGFGGRDAMIKSLENVLNALEAMTKPMSRALDKLLSYNKGWRYLEDKLDTIDIGPVGNTIYQSMVRASKGIEKFTESLIPSEETLESITGICSGFVSVLSVIFDAAKVAVGFVGKIIRVLSPLLKIVLALAGVIGDAIFQIINAIRSSLNLGPAARSVSEFFDNMYESVNTFSDKTVAILHNIPGYITKFLETLKNLRLPDFSTIGRAIVDAFSNAISRFKEKKTLKSFFEGLIEPESVKKAAESIGNTFSGLASTIGGWVDKIKEKILSIGPVGEIIVSIFELVSGTVSSIAKGIFDLLSPILGLTEKVSKKTGDILSELNLSSILDIAKVAVFITSMIRMRKAIKTVAEVVDGAQEVLHNFSYVVKNFGGALKDLGKGVKLSFQAEAFKSIAYAIALVMGSVALLTLTDENKLQSAISAFLAVCAGIMLVMLTISDLGGTAKILRKATPAQDLSKTLKNISKSFAIMSTFIGISSVIVTVIGLIMAIKNLVVTLSEMDPTKLDRGLSAMRACVSQVLAIVAIVGGIAIVLSTIEKLPTKSTIKSVSKLASGLVVFAIGLTALMGPIAIIANMDTGKLAKGIGGMAAMLGILITALAGLSVITKFAPDIGKTISKLSLSLVGFSSTLFTMIGLIFALGKMDSDTASSGMLRLAEAIGLMIAGLAGLAAVIRILGDYSEKLAKISFGFAALAGAAAVISLFAPTIIANAASIKNAIRILVDIVVSSLVDATDKIVDGAMRLIMDVLDALLIYLPTILLQVEGIFTEILNWLIAYTPSFVNKVIQVIGVALSAIADGLGKYIDVKDFVVAIAGLEALVMVIGKMAKLKRHVKKAIPALAMVLVIIGSIGTIFWALQKIGLDGKNAAESSAAISMAILAITPLAKNLALMGKTLKKVKIKTMLGLVASLSLLMGAVGAIFLALNKLDLDPTHLVDYAKGISLALLGVTPIIVAMGTVTAVLGKFKVKAGSVWSLGTSIIGVVTVTVAIVTALMALLGGINKMTDGGFEDVLRNSIEIFGLIGEAIGTLVGGLIGGIAEGGLVLIGEGLGSFATSAKPFFEMVDDLDETFGDKIHALADGVFVLASTAFIDAISNLFSIFTGNSSLENLGYELSGFGTSMSAFFSTMGDIPLEDAQALKYAAEGIKALSDAVPHEGGIFQWFTGKAKFADISNNLEDLGEGLVSFQDATSTVTQESVNKAKIAADMLASLSNAVPKTGGLAQILAGEADLSKFATNLPALGEGIKGFNDAITDAEGNSTISPESIDVAVNAAEMVAALSNHLPKTGGLAQWIAGTQDLDKFADQLPKLATGIVEFDKAVKKDGGIDANTTSVATRVAESIANIYRKLPKTGGWAKVLTGEQDLEKFSDNLRPLGNGIRRFYLAVTKDGVKIDEKTAKLATWVAESAANIQEKLTKNAGFNQWAEGFPNLETFGNNLEPLGDGIRKFTIAIKGTEYTYVEDAMKALNAIADLQNVLDYDDLDYMLAMFDGDSKTKLSLFADNLPMLGSSVMAFSKSVEGINVVNVNAATEAMNMLVGLAELKKKLAGLSLDAFNDALMNLDIDTFNGNIDELLKNNNKPLYDLRDRFIKLGSIFYDAMLEGFSTGYGNENNGGNRQRLIHVVRETLEYVASSFEDHFIRAEGRDIYDRIYAIGTNLLAGIEAGLRDKSAQGKLHGTAQEVMLEVIGGMEYVAAINSPSKKTAEDGKYLIEGLAKGMKDSVGSATSSATIVTDDVMATLKTGMSTISKRLQDPDFDMSPTITPIVDMSNVRLSAKETDDLFNSKRLSLNTDVAGITSLKMARSVKMEAAPSNTDISRAKMLETMTRIGQKLEDMETRLTGMTVVLDTGELVGAVTPAMIRSIDKRKVKMSRGIVPSR